jgi:hypothetical protein
MPVVSRNLWDLRVHDRLAAQARVGRSVARKSLECLRELSASVHRFDDGATEKRRAYIREKGHQEEEP